MQHSGNTSSLDIPFRSLGCEPANRLEIGRLIGLDRLKLYRRGPDIIHADIVTRFRLRLAAAKPWSKKDA
mgnify:CR=1 FL=1